MIQRINSGKVFFYFIVIMIAPLVLSLYSCGGGGGTTQNPPSGNPSVAARTKSLPSGSPQCPTGGITVETGIDQNGNGVLDTYEVNDTQYVCNGLKGSDSLVRTTVEFAGANCANGGVRIDTGPDVNGNSVLDSNEINNTDYVCNYQNSGTGINSLVKTTAEAAGANCTYGGIRVDTGSDLNGNGVLDIAEITGTNYVCNGTGTNSLVKTSQETAGGNCTSGGIRIDTGLDLNSNGVLEAAEITSTNYVCNGQNTSTSSLVKTTAEAAGVNCSSGGVRIDTGLDLNNNSVLEAGEISSTNYVCNGQNTSINSLVKTTAEAEGTNCTSGGIRIDTGLDLNANSVLDTAEITSTSYVCNGADGTGTSDSSNMCRTSYPVDNVISFACNGEAERSRNEYYPFGSCGSGTPVRSCTRESCLYSLEAGNTTIGYYSHQKEYGPGCAGYEYEYLSCNDGYIASNGTCVPALALLTTQQACTDAGKYWWNNACHNDCPPDQVVTSRGCEVPITSCTPYQSVQDNLCLDLLFTSVAGSICGLYDSPVNISAGDHLVTCDSEFQDKVVIEPGANLLVDNYWGITFKNIYSKGTSTNHIVFDKSAGNPAGGWKSLVIQDGESKYHYSDGYLSGNYLSYVDIGGFLESSLTEVTIERTFAENLNLNQPYDVAFTNVYVTNSDFNVKGLKINYPYYNEYTHPNIFIRNTVTSTGTIYLYNTFTAWSVFNNNLTEDYHSALMYSTVTGNVTCYGSTPSKTTSHVYGNQISGTVSTFCAQSDNSTLAVSDKVGAFILDDLIDTIYANQGKDFSVYVLDKTNWLTSANVVWGATYEVDGVPYTYPTTWSGYNPTVLFDTKEAYKLNIGTIDGAGDHIGKKSVTVNVW